MATTLSIDEQEQLAGDILVQLEELAKLEKEHGEDDALKLQERRLEHHMRIIPMLEKAILFSPNDQTMRVVYRKVYDESHCENFDMMRQPLVILSKAFGEAWSREESKELIPRFIETYRVDVSLLTQPVEDFKSLNEFFYRDIDVEKHRPLEPEREGETLLSSMADSHVMGFKPWTSIRGLVVKNKVFTVDTFLGGEETKFASNMEGGTILCVRLDPNHIHRAYAPFDGKLGTPWYGGIAYHTTKPVGIGHHTIDTLGENKRIVIPFENQAFGTCYIVFVGGPLIGSINLRFNPGDMVSRGTEMGYFAYGGSAIYQCFPPDFGGGNKIDWQIPFNQGLDQSTEILLRSTIGSIKHRLE